MTTTATTVATTRSQHVHTLQAGLLQRAAALGLAATVTLAMLQGVLFEAGSSQATELAQRMQASPAATALAPASQPAAPRG